MKLEFESFEKAIDQLAISLDYSRSEMSQKDKGLFNQFRNSVIQCFEFTYELSWKMLKRFIEKSAPAHTLVDQFSFNDLIRIGAEQNLIHDPKLWFDFRNMRNITAHTYNENKAQEIYEEAPILLEEARFLLNQLRARQ